MEKLLQKGVYSQNANSKINDCELRLNKLKIKMANYKLVISRLKRA